MSFKLNIVVPCYNEEAVLGETSKRLEDLITRMIAEGLVSEESCVTFVDDGSRDKTWQLIQQESARRPHIGGLKMSRNRGHQNAVMAGLMTADGDALVTVDADLQDDIEVIADMARRHLEGADIVYGVRCDRTSDSMGKRWTAQGFYKVLSALGVEQVPDHADFRLMSRRAVEAFRQFPEVNLYLRGMVPMLGFPSAKVEYVRAERFAGESKYPLRKMIALAVEAVTSLSTVPLKLIGWIGASVFLISVVFSLWVAFVSLFTDRAVPGWASTVLPLGLLGGVQILCLAVIGTYLGKVYSETKSRPRFLIQEAVSARVTTRRPQDVIATTGPASVARPVSVAGQGL